MSKSNIPIFEQLFQDGAQIAADWGEITFEIRDLGKLNLLSGRIIGCDPLGLTEALPFTTTVPPGEYPVQISIAKIDIDERIAYAKINFSESEVIRWEIATIPGQNPSDLAEDEIFGYGVDSGTGSFMDEVTFQELWDITGEDEAYYMHLIAEKRKTYRHTRSWANVQVEKGNVVMFSSGFGDGSYASYFGFADNGEVAALITDFYVIPWAD